MKNTTATTVTLNPRATIKPLTSAGITPAILEGYKSLTGEAARMAKEHVSHCIKTGQAPIPVEDWVFCPVCEYGSPNSLVSHLKARHGGLQAVADSLGVFPEQITVNSAACLAKFKLAGAKGEIATKAKKAAEVEVKIG